MPQNDEEVSQFTKFKKSFNSFTKELISNEIPIPLLCIFLVVESLQIIAFLHADIISYNSIGVDQMRYLLRVINLQYAIKYQHAQAWSMPVSAILCAVHAVLVLITYKMYKGKVDNKVNNIQQKSFHKNRLQFWVHLLTMCLVTILTVPIFQSSIATLICTSTYSYTPCYSSSSIPVIILSILSLLWILAVNLYFAVYYYSSNPFDHGFMACNSQLYAFGKLLVKITPMIMLIAGRFMTINYIYLGGIAGCYGVTIIMFRFINPVYRYNFRVDTFVMCLQCWTAVVMVVHLPAAIFAAPPMDILILYGFVVGGLAGVMGVMFLKWKKGKLIQEIHGIEKHQAENIMEGIIYAIYKIQSEIKQAGKQKVSKTLGNTNTNTNGKETVINNKEAVHNNNKQEQPVGDSNLSKSKIKERGEGRLHFLSLAMTHRQHCQTLTCPIHQKPFPTTVQSFYSLLICMLDRLIQANKRVYSFQIIKAYILYFKLNSEIKAASTLAKVMNEKLAFSEEMLVEGLLFQLNQRYVDTRDMEIYRKFNEFLLIGEEESIKIAELYLQYWCQLIDQNSSPNKLSALLSDINSRKIKLQGIIAQSLRVFPSHVKVLSLYKNVLKEVINDYQGYLRYEQEYKIGLALNELTNVDAQNTIQFRPNEDLMVLNLTRSNQDQQAFQIITVSSNVGSFLGFLNSQLKNKPLNTLLPKIYHSIHDIFISKLLSLPNPMITSRQLRIYPVTLTGNIIECNLISKYMPSVQYGICIVSFVQKGDMKGSNRFLLIYDGETGVIDSMSQEAQAMLKFGIKRASDSGLAIPDHINDLLPNWDFKKEELKVGVSKQLQSKSIQSISDMRYDVQSITIQRTDGLPGHKHIKILRFTGEYLSKMFTLQMQKPSPTIQKYKQSKTNNWDQQGDDDSKGKTSKTFGSGTIKGNKTSSMVSGNMLDQIQEISMEGSYYQPSTSMISQGTKLVVVGTSKPERRQKTQKSSKGIISKDNNKEGKRNRNKKPVKHPIYSEFSIVFRVVYIIIQCILIITIAALLLFALALITESQLQWQSTASMILQCSQIGRYMASSNYLTTMTIGKQYYQSTYNISLPLPSSSLKEASADLQSISTLLNSLSLSLSTSLPLLSIPYYLSINQSYIKHQTIIDATYQYISNLLYIIDLIKNLLTTTIPELNMHSEWIFIQMNGIVLIPSLWQEQISKRIPQLESIMGSQVGKLNILLIVVCILMGVSGVVSFVLIYAIDKGVGQVFALYNKIRLQQLKPYEMKCLKFKQSLTNRQSVAEIRKRRQSVATEHVQGNQVENQHLDQDQYQQFVLQAANEGQQMGIGLVGVGAGQYVTFERLPSVKGHFLSILMWILGVTTLCIGLHYMNGNLATNLHQSACDLRDSSLLSMYSAQMRNLLMQTAGWQDDGDHNLTSTSTQLLPLLTSTMGKAQQLNQAGVAQTNTTLLSAAFEQIRYISMLFTFTSNNTNEMVKIYAQMQSMDALLGTITELAYASQSNTLQSASQASLSQVIYLICILLIIILYSIVRVALNYSSMLKKHRIAFLMYQILGYNLRKSLEHQHTRTRTHSNVGTHKK